MLRVGFIGLGKIGKPMALHLSKAGFPLTVHSRSAGPVEALVREGATPAGSPAEVAERCDAVLTCLPDVPAVEQVYFGERGLLKHARRGQLFVDHSTVGPGTSRACHEAAKAKGAGFLDAPVSGGPAGAQAATLTIMCGGDKPAFEQALPIFKAMGKNIHHVGGPGCGSIIKLANQLLVAIHTAAAAEAMVLLTKAGADPKVALEVLGTSFGASAMLNRDGPMFLERRFDPGTPVDLIHKDLRLILELADAASVRTLLGGVAKQLYAEASAMGLGQRDMAALVQPLERLAGIQIHH